MKLFLWTLITVWSLRSFFRVIQLGSPQYPRTVRRSASDDVLSLLIRTRARIQHSDGLPLGAR